MTHNEQLGALYRANAEKLGRHFLDDEEAGRRWAASTDMGNVSLVVASIQPLVGIGSLPATNHQPEFATACISPEADQAVIDSATAMAWTIIDAATDANVRSSLTG